MWLSDWSKEGRTPAKGAASSSRGNRLWADIVSDDFGSERHDGMASASACAPPTADADYMNELNPVEGQ